MFFYKEPFFLRRSKQSKNGPDHWAILSLQRLFAKRKYPDNNVNTGGGVFPSQIYKELNVVNGVSLSSTIH